jgi:hypothetical protein
VLLLNAVVSGTNSVETTIFDPLLYTAPLPFTGRFYPLGFPLDVASDSRVAVEAAALSWGPYEARYSEPSMRVHVVTVEGGSAIPPAPAFHAGRHLLAIVSDQENFALCDARQRFGCCWVTRATLADTVVFRWYFLDAMIYMLLEMTVSMAMHAACVAWNNSGVLLCGESGVGKSTLAYACARRGWTYITDDGSNLLLDRRDRMIAGQPHCFRFREDAASMFPEVAGLTVGRELDRKPTIELRTAGLPVRTAQESRVERIVFLDRRPGSACLGPIGKEEARERLLRDVPTLHEDVQARRMQALDCLLEAPAFELRYAAFEEAVGLLERILGGTSA